MIHEDTIQTVPDAAFAWQGQQLNPFSIRRQSIFYALRCALLDAGTSATLGDFLGKACCILWLCTLDKAGLDALPRNASTCADMALDWGDANIAKGMQADAIRLALDIYNDAQEESVVAVNDDPVASIASPGKP